MKKINSLLLLTALSLPCLSGIGWGESGLHPILAGTQTPKIEDIGGEAGEAHKKRQPSTPSHAGPLHPGTMRGSGGSRYMHQQMHRRSPLADYKPGAPMRTSVGKGYILRGLVKDKHGPVSGARLEFWLAGPDGRYDDAHRATVISDKEGSYQFESNFPPKTAAGPPQINLMVTATGHWDLIIKHYPKVGQTQGTRDLVLKPRPVPPRRNSGPNNMPK
jgi:hypothetical protein